jgi:hypothetical protein
MTSTIAWSQLLHLGDLSLTVPTGGAIAAWLLAGRAWRAAAGWVVMFGLALGLVAASKIAFLGWAAGVPALDFKAVSGHATGFAAVFPTLCYLLAPGRPRRTRAIGAAAALALAAVVTAALVHAGEHTLAEAVAGWLIGTGVFLCTAHLAGDLPAPPAGCAIACAALAFLAAAWLLRAAPLNWWMIKVALVLSGNPAPTPWDHCG